MREVIFTKEDETVEHVCKCIFGGEFNKEIYTFSVEK